MQTAVQTVYYILILMVKTEFRSIPYEIGKRVATSLFSNEEVAFVGWTSALADEKSSKAAALNNNKQ